MLESRHYHITTDIIQMFQVSVGLVIGHVGPEAAIGGPIALLRDGDSIIVDLNQNKLDCLELNDKEALQRRKKFWKKSVLDNDGTHPALGDADTRLLNRMRESAVSAVYGAGMHPGGKVWMSNPREVEKPSFEPKNKYR